MQNCVNMQYCNLDSILYLIDYVVYLFQQHIWSILNADVIDLAAPMQLRHEFTCFAVCDE